jgi:prepilin-type N-terminal cleavage/methylation domain-containing protein
MHNKARRNGFTLIELLVVIAIIATLATLVIGATMRFISTQKETNTRVIIQNVDKALQKQWAKVIADAKAEPTANFDYSGSPVMSMAGQDRTRARIIWIKMRLMEAFPMTYAECDPSTNPLYITPTVANPYIPASSQRRYIASYKKKLAGSTVTLVNGIDTQSAACLLMALSVNKVLDPDSIASNLGQEVLANGTKQNQYIIDGWGNPVLFFRFPTPDLSTWVPLGYNSTVIPNPKAMDPQSNNPAANTTLGKGVGADPVDPEGKLQNPNWNSGQFVSFCHPVQNGNGAWYITPVIASAGSDQKAGLTANFSISNATDAGDNIYNYLLRFGATGN